MLTDRELALFWLRCLIGQSQAKYAEAKVESLAYAIPDKANVIAWLAFHHDLNGLLKFYGISKRRRLIRAIHESVDLDLRRDTAGQLQVHGVGPVTAEYFVSRRA